MMERKVDLVDSKKSESPFSQYSNFADTYCNIWFPKSIGGERENLRKNPNI